MTQKYSVESIWILIRLHIFWKFIETYGIRLVIAERGGDTQYFVRGRKKVLTAVDLWKALPIPELLNSWFEKPETIEKGSIASLFEGKATGAISQVFSLEDMDDNLYSLLSPLLRISCVPFEQGVLIVDRSATVATFNEKDGLVIEESREGKAFAFFMNAVFKSTELPSLEEFQAADPTRILDYKENAAKKVT